MRNPYLPLLSLIALFAVSSCNKKSDEAAKKIATLEQQNKAATDRQRELEQQLADQKLAAERDAIERDRAKIEEDRAALAQRQGEAELANDEAIRAREEALARREGKLEELQSSLEEKQDEFLQRSQQLNDKERDLAGREALPFEQSEQAQQAAPARDYDMFYQSLSPYGSWFETADYGYVWQPAAVRESNWRPYSRGRWACSDRGWTWVSEEPFGWATYHYGRWALLQNHGWIWVPGTEWAPCWVSWRENDDHIGWAPLPPETLAYHGHSWDSNVDIQFSIGATCYNFVSILNFGNPVYRHCLPLSGNITIIAQTVNITHIHIQNRQIICGGPRYRQVSDRIGRPLPFYRLQVDRHPKTSRDPLGMRPRIQDGRLVVSAPNIDIAHQENQKPGRIKANLEKVTVQRNGVLSDEITARYRQSREEERQLTKLKPPTEESRDVAGNPNKKVVSIPDVDANSLRPDNRPPLIQTSKKSPESQGGPNVISEEPKADRSLTERQAHIEATRENERIPDKHVIPPPPDRVGQSKTNPKVQTIPTERKTAGEIVTPAVATEERLKKSPDPTAGPRVVPKPNPDQDQVAAIRQQQALQAEKEQMRQKAIQEKQVQAEQARIQQQAEFKQRQQQEEAQRQRELARQQQQETARQQMEARRQQEMARRQQEVQRQQEIARQQQEAQRQQEMARRQQEAQRQQETARQQQREENDRRRSRNP